MNSTPENPVLTAPHSSSCDENRRPLLSNHQLSTINYQSLHYCSVNGKSFRLQNISDDSISQLRQPHQLTEAVARLLALRGIIPAHAAEFLQPTLRNSLPNPSDFADMDRATHRLAEAIEKSQSIGIFGDYDVDGSTSTALLLRFLRALNHPASATHYHIPDRVKEGYGPNPLAMQQLAAKGVQLLVTVDCGTTAIEALAEATRSGMDTIVVDHHLTTQALPKVYAIVNPHRLDDATPHKQLAAVGVTFLLVVATQRRLRETGFLSPENSASQSAILLELLDLVALGTVCDVMPLTGLNRTYVAQGLKILKNYNNLGLRALADAAHLQEAPTASSLGFIFGPRINAGGRIGESDLGVRLLTTQSPEEATNLAHQLHRLNQERQAIELLALEQALTQAEHQQNAPVLIVSDHLLPERWHPGIIGLLAARLKERYNRPALAIATESPEKPGKGSARSVAGTDIGAAITEAVSLGLLNQGGGHAMAGGFSIDMAQLDAFSAYLQEKLAPSVNAYLADPAYKADLLLPPSAITPDFLEQCAALEPYGVGNPEPRLLLRNCFIYQTRIVGEQHISALIGDDGLYSERKLLKAICFRSLNTPLGDALFSAKGKKCMLAGKARKNEWQGRIRAEFQIEDLAWT